MNPMPPPLAEMTLSRIESSVAVNSGLGPTSMPPQPLPSGRVPVTSVPMRLPWISAPVESLSCDAVAAVGRDQVAAPRPRPRRWSARGTSLRFTPVAVAHRRGVPGGVGADEVALDHDAGGVLREDPAARIRRDHVAGRGRRPADGHRRRPVDEDAVVRVPGRGRRPASGR